jgi:hypothetical protein
LCSMRGKWQVEADQYSIVRRHNGAWSNLAMTVKSCDVEEN